MSALTQLAGAVMLLCAFLLISQARLPGMIRLYRLQSIALSVAALAQGVAQGDAALCLASLITLLLGVVLLPNALWRVLPRLGPGSATPRALTLVLAIGLVGVAVLVVPPTPARANLTLSLAVLLLGLLLMARSHSHNPVSQLIGFLSLGNGLLLAAIATPELPFIAWLAAAPPALGLSLLSLLLLHMQVPP